MSVLGHLYKSENSSPIIEVSSQFFFRSGQNSNVDKTFRFKKITKMVEVHDIKVQAALNSRNWINFGERKPEIGDRLLFEVNSIWKGISQDEKFINSIETTGNIFAIGELNIDRWGKIGEINFRSFQR